MKYLLTETIVGPDATAEREYERTRDRLSVAITQDTIVINDNLGRALSYGEFDRIVEAVMEARRKIDHAIVGGES